jgi:hypothetical protein
MGCAWGTIARIVCVVWSYLRYVLHCSPFAAEWGGERTVFYGEHEADDWVTTADHDEDWFILAERARQARAYHENYEGYGKGDASSRLIVSDVTLDELVGGKPPCHAQMPDLLQLGFEDAGTEPNLRRVQLNGEMFEEGILESIVDTGRKNQVFVQALGNRLMQRKEATSATTEPEAALGVKTSSRMVS